ncbi:unnamed protein product [Phytophthora fragariaefolia]|uniref:Unnamed protein product n=1 Tax=Phytophthora fragariaefolia TaxID=1490495 RepID=A0A9W6UBV9_9STRA|nr:unnamed protein product [Phytophthora fragariaefolia]
MAGLGIAQYHEAVAYLQEVARQVKKGSFSRASQSVLCVAERDSEVDIEPTASESDVEISGNPSDESSNPSGESGNKLGNQSGEAGTTLGDKSQEMTNPSTEQTRTLEPANESAFEISSPPRSRGRPKQTAKTKKPSRNKAVTMAADDSDMLALNLSLENVQVAVNNQPSYTSSATLLTRFKMFEIAKKSRQPIAHKVSSLSASKQVTRNAAITRIFRVDLIERRLDKVAALQKKVTAAGRQNLAEQQAVVEIIGVGIYSTNTIRTMKKWHQAMTSIRIVDKAISWVDTITFTLTMHKGFQVEPNPEIPSKLKSIPLLTSQLVGKTALGNCTVNMLVAKMFADRTYTIGVDTSVAGNVINGYLPILSMQGVFTGLKQEKVLIPVICGRNHWCSIMIALTLKEVCINDPMASSYTLRVRSLAENLLGFLPDFAPRKYRVRLYVSELGVPVDSYNC